MADVMTPSDVDLQNRIFNELKQFKYVYEYTSSILYDASRGLTIDYNTSSIVLWFWLHQAQIDAPVDFMFNNQERERYDSLPEYGKWKDGVVPVIKDIVEHNKALFVIIVARMARRFGDRRITFSDRLDSMRIRTPVGEFTATPFEGCMTGNDSY